ncbi:MAG TPA: GDP-mannose 4,6-dehydratase [Dehalococcoidia bacterium]|nr:GDP-mannose 4,6-dehydratase [Dehalococcoidia bacterium]
MRALVTGATGFVGPYLLRLLTARGWEVYATVRPGERLGRGEGVRFLRCDIRDEKRLRSIVRKVRPHRIYHLAALTSVRDSHRQFRTVYDTNFWGTFHLLEAVRECYRQARVLIVGSGQAYGRTKEGRRPLTESSPLAPESPYALSKAAADMLGYFYAQHYGLNVVRARPFNHTGPGQPPSFVCSELARQVAAIELELAAPVLRVGNMKARRDFSDVRDVVQAYWLLLEKGKKGEAYNVCSGRHVSIAEIIRRLSGFTSRGFRLVVEENRLRLGEARVLYGSNQKLRRETGWRPRHTLRQTLQDLTSYWKEKLSKKQ